MDHKRWHTSTDASAMLQALPSPLSARKMRLFSVGICEFFLHVVQSQHFADTLNFARLFADGETSKAALKRARQAVRNVRHQLPEKELPHPEWAALWLAEVAASENAYGGVHAEVEAFVTRSVLDPQQLPPAADILRCIAGNPFEPAPLEAKWLSKQVKQTAATIYEDRKFGRLPELAEQLEAAGCDDPDILQHCVAGGSHTRGCWLIDLLTGRS